MLHVLLVILKVAGIVLLSILLILLLLILLVLFVPIRYSGYARKNSEVYAKVTVSWLFHFIHFNFYYDQDGVRQVIRIFGIPIDVLKEFFNKLKSIFRLKKTKNKKSKNKNSKKVRTKTDKSKQASVEISNKGLNHEDLPNGMDISVPAEEFEVKKEEIVQNRNDTFSHKVASKEKEPYKKITAKKSKRKQKFSVRKWFIRLKNKLKNFIRKVKNLIKKFISLCKNAKNKVDDIKAFLQDDSNIEAFKTCKNQLIIALKHIRPKKYKIYMKFGTGDPALTGQILGILGMLMPLYKNNANFIPDFENAILEGEIYLKGRVTVARVLWIAWNLYRDKNVRRCYNMIMD